MKSKLALFLAFALIIISSLYPVNIISASEDTQGNGNMSDAVTDESESVPETEHPESYYLPIQSNETPKWPEGPQVEAEAAIVMDANTGAILYEKNIDSELFPASITKVMTLLVALENGNLDDVITFSYNAVTNLEPGSSHIGIRENEELTLEQSLYALMLASANEVANGIAEHIGGSIDEFVGMMNEKAAELGCQHTHFTNAHGLQNESHYTSAYDMALIMKAGMENPDFVKFIGTKSYTIPATNIVDEERPLANHHKMLVDNTSYSYDGCIGGKTGFTSDALNTLATISSKNGMELICVTLKTNGADKSYEAATALFNYVYDNFTTTSIQDNEETFKEPKRNLLKQGWFLNEESRRTLITVTGNNILIVPKDTSFDKLTHTLAFERNSVRTKTIVSYFFNGRFLGTTTVRFEPLFEKVIDTIPVGNPQNSLRDGSSDSLESNIEESLSYTDDIVLNSSDHNIQMTESSNSTISETSEFIHQTLSNKIRIIANTPKYLAYLAAGFVILAFLIFVIIKLMKNHKIQKRRLDKREKNNPENS